MSIFTNVLSILVAAYMFGRWLARKTPGRELTVYVITWILSQAVTLAVLRLQAPLASDYGFWGDLIMDVLLAIGGTIFVVAGVERGQVRQAAD